MNIEQKYNHKIKVHSIIYIEIERRADSKYN